MIDVSSFLKHLKTFKQSDDSLLLYYSIAFAQLSVLDKEEKYELFQKALQNCRTQRDLWEKIFLLNQQLKIKTLWKLSNQSISHWKCKIFAIPYSVLPFLSFIAKKEKKP